MMGNSDKFGRATKGMRFHIFSQLLETYVGVLGIAEGFWGVKMVEMRREGLVA
jgi:hypothetical protein